MQSLDERVRIAMQRLRLLGHTSVTVRELMKWLPFRKRGEDSVAVLGAAERCAKETP